LLLGPDRVSIADIRQSLVSLLLQNLGYNPPNSL
jgi:hypothetical protein